MSSFKKIAWSGSAVLLAMVMSLGVMVQPALAANEAAGAVTINRASNTAQTATTYTVVFTNGTVGGANNTVLAGGNTITVDFVGAGAGTDIRMTGASTFTPGAGFVGAGCATSTVGAGANAGIAVITLNAPCAVANDAIGVTFTLSNITNGNAAAAASLGGLSTDGTVDDVTLTAATNTVITDAVVVAPGAGCTGGGLCVDGFTLIAAALTCNTANLAAGARPGAATADGSVAYKLCFHVSSSSTNNIDTPATFTDQNPVDGAVVNLTTSLGVLGTGTSKTSTVITAAGFGSTNYRGAGNQTSTDTVIAAVQGPTSAVGTLAINLTAGSGNTASKVAFNAPNVLAIAATQTNTSPNYQSPTTQTNVSVKITDSSGLGVNNEQVLISTDKGAVQNGFNAACGTTKAMTQPTAVLAPAVGATAESGIIQLTFCANQLDAPGKATLTAQNVTTSMANATVSIAMSGRPTKLEPTVTGAAISVKVSDAGGNAVADGTPVRFTISPNAGAVSTGCTTTTNGAASAVAALIANTGLVIISTDWNETGAAASCVAAGAQQLATSVNVSGGTATLGGGTGTGVLTSGSIPATGFGLIVFSGGTIAQLVTASGVGNTGALYATVGGIFVPYVPGTTIAAVNADFLAAFPGGNIPANTAFVGRK